MPRPTGAGQPVRTRAERLAADLGDRLASASPGDPVGTIESLRAETGFAYSTVSEAVRLLRDRGLLEVRPGRGGGLFAADRGPVVRMRHTLLAVTDDPAAVADAVELREHLEVLVDVGAARCRTAADVVELRTLVQALRDAADWSAFLHANWALHERIAVICPNATARAVYSATLGQLDATDPRPDDVDQAYREHRVLVHHDLVEAIAAGDEDAVRAVVAQHND